MTNEREKRNRYYKHIVKRHLNDIREHIGLSTNEWKGVITIPVMQSN